MSQQGYIDYFEVLGLAEDSKQGEVRNQYKRRMRDLVMEIQRIEITADRRERYLLELAKVNAAFYILRNTALRDEYVADRAKIIALEEQWGQAVASGSGEVDNLRRAFDSALRHYLTRYMEDLMLVAGRDEECVEASHWDADHERHASRILRHYRQEQYHRIHERLPYYDVTQPNIDWDERERTAREILTAGAH